MAEAIYILDEANGMFTTMNKTKINLQTYIGPFESVDKAMGYLSRMTNFDNGGTVPEGYALIKMVAPLENYDKLPNPEPFIFKEESRKLKFDLKLRYDQAPKRRLKKK